MDQSMSCTGSQASSHFSLEPVSGSVLFDLELRRRRLLEERGYFKVGCKEIDEYVLAGGFEGGCVAGISAEDPDFGLLVSCSPFFLSFSPLG